MHSSDTCELFMSQVTDLSSISSCHLMMHNLTFQFTDFCQLILKIKLEKEYTWHRGSTWSNVHALLKWTCLD